MEDAALALSPPPARGLAAVRAIVGDIHVEQTLFSAPFLVVSALLAQAGLPEGAAPASRWLWIAIALIAARAAAMAINRFADAFIDGRNPRTARRAVPSGRVKRSSMLVFAIAATALFVFAAAQLNPLCLMLSPVALLFLVGYSWTKRFTPLCHVWLGLAIGIAPLGAWVGMRGDLSDPTPWLLGAAVAAWIAGFDILYSCPDVEIDRLDGLRSIPQTLGVEPAFRVSEALHAATIGLLAAVGTLRPHPGPAWWVGLGVGAALLLVEHRIVRPGDYRQMPTAFFRLNAVFGAVFLAATVVDLFVLS